MLKITAIVSFIFIVSSVWSACDSCGSGCASSCGTRRFKACCFNYLRKKRGPDAVEVQTMPQDVKVSRLSPELPVYIVRNIPMPEQWFDNVLLRESHPFTVEDMVDN